MILARLLELFVAPLLNRRKKVALFTSTVVELFGHRNKKQAMQHWHTEFQLKRRGHAL
jgi:hypothetical protein